MKYLPFINADVHLLETRDDRRLRILMTFTGVPDDEWLTQARWAAWRAQHRVMATWEPWERVN